MVFRYAQTNLQLINQMLTEGYALEEVHLATRAYALSTELHASLYRPTGKPFVSHLVGTASILVARSFSIHMITAALLHASYAIGDFGDGKKGATDRHRKAVRDVIGVDSEDLVYAYTERPWNSDHIAAYLEGLPRLNQQDRQALTIRLANELEDYLDGGMRVSPRKLRKLERKGRRGGNVVAIARGLDLPDLAEELETAQTEVLDKEALPAELCSTHTVSYWIGSKSKD